MSNYSTKIHWALPLAISGILQLATAETITYTNAGVYTNVVPAGVMKGTFKLWGAGGGGSLVPPPPAPFLAFGGGGAFSAVTLDVQPGDSFVIVVGQRGATNVASLGGAGSGNTEGGMPGSVNGFQTSQGGQASSVFLITNNLFLTKAVAGGGGGAGYSADGGAGGQPGQGFPPAQGGGPGFSGNGGTGNSGGNYNASAITVGISALSQAGGNGGAGIYYSGGGGGGYGGGGGGVSSPASNGAGGGGGASYGSTTVTGVGAGPGNALDTNYVGNAGQGGPPNASGFDGLAVIFWLPAPVPPSLTPSLLADGSFRLSFTNVSGTTFNALGTTNVADSNGWSVLGPVTEVSAGQFQFTDSQATNYPWRFYEVKSR